MKNPGKRYIKTAVIALALLLVFILSASADQSSAAALPTLFQDGVGQLNGEIDLPDPLHPEIIRQRSAEVDFSVLDQFSRSVPRTGEPAFTLNLFEDTQFIVTVTKTEMFPNGAVGLVGTVDYGIYSELVLVSNQGVVQAYLQVDEEYYEIRAVQGGHLIVEVDQSAYPDPLPPAVPDQADPTPAAAMAFDAVAEPDSATYIDVLAVYTAGAVSYLGSQTAVETRIQQSILSANTGYADSGINQQLRLVGMEQVSYDENAGNATNQQKWYDALDRLTFGKAASDPSNANYLADARNYRDQYGADLVFMVTDLPYIYCGLGWIAGGAGHSGYGYSVLHSDCTGSTSFTPQHEMGHNMGACHDWNNTSVDTKPFCYDTYSYGFQQPNQFYTVMAYSAGCGTCNRINRWSNPNQTYGGYSLSGLVSDQSVYPDNRLTLNTTAINVANYRQSIISPISGEFTNPTDDNRVNWPRTTLRFTASSTEGTISSVQFQAYYDGSWHNLGIDSTSGDGWEMDWNSSSVTQQAIELRAIVTDSASNTETIRQNNLTLTSAQVSDYGYESKGSRPDIAVESVEESQPVEIVLLPLLSDEPAPVVPADPPQEIRRLPDTPRRLKPD